MKQPTAPPAQIYPELPATSSGENYRLQEISSLKRRLEEERDLRAQLYKKYRRGVNALDGVDATLLAVSLGLGIGGVGLLSTIIAAPVVLGLELGALSTGLLGISCKFVGRRLAIKAKKHNDVRVLAESKLDTIADHVSKALNDGRVSDEEFRLIIEELGKYDQMKSQIRAGARKAHAAVELDEETKNSLIRRGRDQARASFIKKLAEPSS